MRFEAGDSVYLPDEGVGDVLAVSGSTCTIAWRRSGAVTSTPLAKLGDRGERALIPPRAVELVYDTLRNKPPSPDLRPWEQRHAFYVHRIQTGDPLALARVLRELARLGASRPLTPTERSVRDHAQALLVEELAAVLAVPEATVAAEIEALLKR